MEISSITSVPFVNAIQNNPRMQENIKRVAAPALLTSGAVFVATRAPKMAEGAVKTAENTLKLSTRAKRAGVAGLVTAGIMAVLSLNKQNVVQGVNKVKEIFKRTDGEKALETATGIKDKEEPIQEKEPAVSTNPFANEETVNQTQINLDDAIKQANALTNNIQPAQQPQQSTTPFASANIQAPGMSVATNPFA